MAIFGWLICICWLIGTVAIAATDFMPGRLSTFCAFAITTITCAQKIGWLP